VLATLTFKLEVTMTHTCMDEVVLEQHFEIHMHPCLSNGPPQPLRLLITAALRHRRFERRQAVRPCAIRCCCHLTRPHTVADDSIVDTAAAATAADAADGVFVC
jgi:hypothetical protein